MIPTPKKQDPAQRTLCGHGDVAADGDPTWDMPPYEPMGAVQGKVMDSKNGGEHDLRRAHRASVRREISTRRNSCATIRNLIGNPP